jgi:hypothetical protein
VRPQGLVGNACIVGNRSFGGTRYSFHMSTTQIGMYNGIDYRAINYATTAGIWYHLAFVCSPSQTLVYVNGNPIALTNNVIRGWFWNGGESNGTTGQQMSIGCVRDMGGTYEFFKGDIDDLRIWNYERSMTDINDEMNSTLNGSEPGLVGLFNFDQGIASSNNAGLTTLNESVASNNGAMSNFALSGGLSNYIPRHTTLPVSLNEFKASHQNAAVLLQWSTATEQNSQSFVIERSTDGTNFTAIGNSGTKRSYQFRDASPSKGNNYYRLKLVDADAKFAYSEIRMVSFSIDAKLVWFAQGKNAVVQLNGGANEQYIVSDMKGATAMQGRLENGRILISGKTAGFYNVRVWTASGVKSIKVVIQ